MGYAKRLAVNVKPSQVKWVFLRGLVGCLQLLCALVALKLKVPLGDNSALMTTNVVVAAVLGRAFLGESFRLFHFVAVCLSFGGALIVCKPDLFANGDDVVAFHAPWYGYAISLFAGFMAGLQFLTSRMLQKVHPLVMTTSVALQEGFLFLLIAFSGVSGEADFAMIWQAPMITLALVAGIMLLLCGASTTFSAGAQLCPVAMSSTIFTSCSMSLSYFAQVVLKGQFPHFVTMCGAISMLSAVAVMAFARWYEGRPQVACTSLEFQAQENTISAVGSGVVEDNPAAATESSLDDSDTQSLASFAASEFSGISKSMGPAVIRRSYAAAISAAAQMVGAVSV